MFGRRSSTEPAPAPPSEPGVKPASKGRPTPRRREAEQRNRRPVVPPRLSPNATKEEKKAARAAARDASNAERTRSREAMLTGDEKHLPLQHRGPARRWVRDYVDARRNLGDYLFPVAIVVLGLGLLPQLKLVSLLSIPLLYLFLLVVIIDAYFLSRRINRLATERFGQQAAGAGRYGAIRSLQIRRFRLPRPQVKRGEYPG